jgi:hypothetical protein
MGFIGKLNGLNNTYVLTSEHGKILLSFAYMYIHIIIISWLMGAMLQSMLQ